MLPLFLHICRARTVKKNPGDSLHFPHVIPLDKMIWMMQIILLLWMMLIPQSLSLGMFKITFCRSFVM
jgi:hypothetical protein